MSRLRVIWVRSLVFLVFFSFGISTVYAEDPVFTARYATQLSKTFQLTEADYMFAELVAKKTDGRLKIEVYPAGQLYKERAIVKAITDGALDMGIIYSGAWNGQLPYIDIFDVPFVFKSMQELHQALTGALGRMIDEDLKKFNAKLLHVGYYGRSFEIANSVRPLKTAADFKGLKIRVNLPLSIESMKAMGAAPSQIASSEVYMALQRKTIDGVVSGVQSIINRKWNETCKYLTITNATFSPWLVTANTAFWEKLPADIRQAVLEAGAEVSKITLEKAESEDAAGFADARKSMEVFELKQPWNEAKQAGLDFWRERSGDEKAKQVLSLIAGK